MFNKNGRRIFCYLVLLVLSLFVFTLTDVSAQYNYKPELKWWAELDKEDSRYVEITLDLADFKKKGYFVSKNISCGIKLKDKNGQVKTKTFSVDYKNLNYDEINKRYGRHGFSSISEAVGTEATYDFRQLIMRSAAFEIPMDNYEYFCSAYDIDGSLRPGIKRNANGTFSPKKGYHWVFPDLKNNYCVELNEGLIITEDGYLKPANGYRWVTKDDADVRVERIP